MCVRWSLSECWVVCVSPTDSSHRVSCRKPTSTHTHAYITQHIHTHTRHIPITCSHTNHPPVPHSHIYLYIGGGLHGRRARLGGGFEGGDCAAAGVRRYVVKCMYESVCVWSREEDENRSYPLSPSHHPQTHNTRPIPPYKTHTTHQPDTNPTQPSRPTNVTHTSTHTPTHLHTYTHTNPIHLPNPNTHSHRGRRTRLPALRVRRALLPLRHPVGPWGLSRGLWRGRGERAAVLVNLVYMLLQSPRTLSFPCLFLSHALCTWDTHARSCPPMLLTPPAQTHKGINAHKNNIYLSNAHPTPRPHTNTHT